MWNFGNLFWKLLGLSEASFQHGWLDLSLRSPKHFEIFVKAFQRVLQRTKCPSVKFGNFSDDFLCQSLTMKNKNKNFRDLEKCKYLHNQAMDLKFKGTVRKPTKFTLREYIDNLPVYLVKFGEF